MNDQYDEEKAQQTQEDSASIEVEIVEEQQTDSRGMYKAYGNYYDQPEDKSYEGFGIASMVLGIVAVCCTCCLPIVGMIPAILAIIFGAIGFKAINRGMAIAGFALGIVSILPQLLLVLLMVKTVG